MSEQIEYKEIHIKNFGDIPDTGAWLTIWPNGTKWWFVDDKLHRLDGRAVEGADGTMEFWIDGREYAEDKYWREVNRITGGCKMSKLVTTTIKVSVHRAGKNPIFGEGAIHVSVEDEAAGAFIIIESTDGQDKGLRIDLDELEAVIAAARRMVEKYEEVSQ